MTSYTISGPDGRKVKVTAPPGASPEQVQAKIQQVKLNWDQFAPKTKTRDEEIMEGLEAPGVAQRMLRGIPGLGGALDEIGAGADAAINTVSGGRFGSPYDESLAKRRAAIAKSDEENPIQNTALAVGTGIAALPALPAARLFTNPTAPTITARAADAGLTAAGYGVATGFTEGEGGFVNRAQNAVNVGGVSGALGLVLGGAAQYLANRAAPTAANSVTQQADDIGVRIPAFMEGGRPSQDIAGKLGGIPFIGDDINQAVAVTRSQTGDAARRISERTAGGAVTPQSGGEAVRDAAVDWVGTTARQAQNRVYDALERQMGGVVVPLSATRQTAARLAAEQTDAATPLHGVALGTIEEALGRPNGLAYEGLSRLRTQIGRMIDNNIDPNNATARAGLQSLYGALTDDMQTAITTNGGQRGRQLWDRAQAVARQVAERRETVAKLVGAQGDKSGEGITDRIVAMASSKSSADAARLGQVRRVVGADAWRQLAGTAIQRLGRNQSNDFSADIFLKNYRQMSDAGRRLLFGSTGDNIIADLDRLAAVSARLQQFSRLGNPSGSGGVGAVLAALAGAGAGDMGATAGTMLAGRGVGYLMSRPAVVRQASAYSVALERFLRSRRGQASMASAAAALARVVSKETGEDPAAIEARIQAASQ